MANFEVEQNGTSGTANILTSAVAIGGQLYSGVDKDVFKNWCRRCILWLDK